MNEDRSIDLLIDILKLIKKYGFETVEDLSMNLSTSRYNSIMYELLSGIVVAKKSMKNNKLETKKRDSDHESIRSKLEKMGSVDPEKGRVLMDFYDNLMAKKALPTLRELKDFALDSGLPVIKVRSRDAAIASIINKLSGIELSEMKRILSNVPLRNGGAERSIEGWGGIILGGEKGEGRNSGGSPSGRKNRKK